MTKDDEVEMAARLVQQARHLTWGSRMAVALPLLREAIQEALSVDDIPADASAALMDLRAAGATVDLILLRDARHAP